MNTIKRDAAEPESHDDLMRFMGIFWERKSFIFLGVILGLLVGTLYYVKVKPVYQSTARVLVVKKSPDVLPMHGADPRQPLFDDYVGTQQVLIRSPAVLKILVNDPEFQKLNFSKTESVAIEQIRSSLKVLRGADKEMEGGTSGAAVVGGGLSVLTFIFKSGNQDECTKVVQLLVSAYHVYLQNTFNQGNKQFVDLIQQASTIQKEQLANKRTELHKLLVSKPELAKHVDAKEGNLAVPDLFQKYQDQKAALELRKSEIESHLSSLARAERDKQPGQVLRSMIARFDHLSPDSIGKPSSAEMDFESTLFKLLLDEKRLGTKFGPEHAELQQVRQTIDFIKELLVKRESGILNGTRDADMLKLHKTLVLQELLDIKERDENFTRLIEKEREKASQSLDGQIRLAGLQQETKTLETLQQNIFEQISRTQVSRDAGGYQAEVVDNPSLAIQVEPKIALTFSLAAVAGLMVGLALAYLTDLTDRSFRTPVEIARSLKMPVVGHVPVITAKVLPNGETKLSPYLCTHHRPKSRDAEAFRAIRTALYFNTRNTSCRKLQVTSASSGDGKSTMASNLAISIAQSGKRVLLVDCDLRRPTIHTLFGLPNDAGFSNVLTEHMEPADVTHVDVVPGLSLISAGPSLPNPAEILTSTRFQDCANHLSEKYDFVLFDTPPLLAVTDPAVIAPRMDGVFLVVHLDKSGRGMAERSAEILRTLEVNVIGVVVNAGKEGVGYYGGYGSYGKYHYGRYSYYYGSGGYRYGNGYTYGNEAYYTDEDQSASDVIARPTTNGHTAAAGASKGHENGTNGDQPAQPGSIKRAFRWFLGD